MTLTEELEKTLRRAYLEAKTRKHEMVTVEHLLYALTFDKSASHIIQSCGGNVLTLRSDLESFFKIHLQSITQENETSPQHTLGFQYLLQTAAAQVQAAQKEEIDVGSILVAIFREPESHAVYYLTKQNITRLDLLKYLSHGIHTPSASTDGVKTEQTPLVKFCVNLNKRAEEGKIDPLIGREKEIERSIHILSRRRKNNPILVGDAGVGKTAIAEGLALKIVSREVPETLQNMTIFSLDMGALLAGTKFRGDFEERIKSVLDMLKKERNPVLFIDEIHTLIGAGSVSGGTIDASNLLKPILASGEIKCIGTTTYKEYRNIFEKDHALCRRFQKVEINEPSIEESIKILEGLKKHYESFHQVEYSQESLEAAVHLSSKHISDRALPDKAIDIIDEAGAEAKLNRSNKEKINRIDFQDIEKVVSRVSKIPPQTIQIDEKIKLRELSGDLKKAIFGQEIAIDKVVQSIQLSKAGLVEPDKPIGSFLFAGPTGVGKTEMARQLSKTLGIEFIRFDMSEYMEKHTVSRLIGSPPGYVGFDQGGQLTEAVHRHPHSVLLLDEIEKAHEDVYNLLLQIMDYATLTDNNGRKSDFKQIILILTTNTGARESMVRSIGFQKKAYEDKSLKEIEKAFSPEFRNRLTSIVQFAPLNVETAKQIVLKIVHELEERIKIKGVELTLEESAVQYLAEKGFDAQYGARPLKRIIESEISHPLSSEILFGKLINGGKVSVVYEDEKVSFKF